MKFPIKTALLLLAVSVAASHAYVGKWHSFTDKEGVRSLITHQGYLYAGTQGGIRRINPATHEEKDYDNLDGLIDCSITGMAEDGDGALWAVSRGGYVYKLSGNHWEIFGRRYAAQQWLMNDRAVIASGHFLFLGSEKGLTVFDLVLGVSQANVNRFRNVIDVPVLSLLRRADTLYIGTPQGVYKAGVNFNNPLDTAYGNLSDPNIWTPATAFIADSLNPYNFLAFSGDTLKAFGPGTLLQGSVPVSAFKGKPAVIGNQSYAARTDLTSALALGNRIFLGGEKGIFVSSYPFNGDTALSNLSAPSTFPRDTVWNVAAHQADLWGQSPNGLYHMNSTTGDTNFFTDILTDGGVRIISPEFIYRHLMNLKTADNGDVYVGSWGGGLVRIRNEESRSWNSPVRQPCIFAVSPDYYVVHSVSNIHKNQLYFTMLEGESGSTHQLVFLNTETEAITCLDSTVEGVYPHAVHVFSDSLIGIGSERGVVFMKIRQGFTPTRTSLGLWTTLNGSSNETWGIATDASGRPWALMGNQLAYVEKNSLDSAAAHPGQWPDARKRLQIAAGFTGTDCYSLEGDPLGSLWVGCGNGLFHVVPNAEGIAKMDRYGLDDGLLSLSISDISVDPANGKVWVATDRGVSMLESASQPPVTTGLQSVQVYPNPFRPQHRFVIFDNLPRDAIVRLHNAAGAVVRIFHPRDLSGNQAQWDGTNQDGRPVSAGVYLYSVTSGSTVERGKVIVAR